MSFKSLFQAVLSIPFLSIPLWAAADTVTSRINLRWVDEEVRQHNPDVQAALAEIEMSKAGVTASRSWPDPQVGVEFWDFPRPGLDLSAANQKLLDISQEIPFPSKTILQSEIAGHALRLQQMQAEKTLQDHIFTARQAYWDLFTASESLKVLSKIERVLGHLAELAGRRTGQGRGGRMEQLMGPMARMERTGLENQALALEQERLDARARLAQEIGGTLPEGILDPDVGGLVACSNADLTRLQAMALAASPGILQARHHLLHTQAQQSLAEAGWLPDLMLQYSLVENTGGPQSGMAMAKVNLPFVWFWRQGAEVKAAQGAVTEASAMLHSAEGETAALVKNEAAMLRTSKRQLENDRTEALPDAEKALDLGISGYTAGSLGAPESLDAVKSYLMVHLETIALTAQIGRSIAGLEALADAGLPEQNAMEMNHENQ